MIKKHNPESGSESGETPKSNRDFVAERIAWLQDGADPDKMPQPDAMAVDAKLQQIIQKASGTIG